METVFAHVALGMFVDIAFFNCYAVSSSYDGRRQAVFSGAICALTLIAMSIAAIGAGVVEAIL